MEPDLIKEMNELEKERKELEKQVEEIISKNGNEFFNKNKKEIESEIENEMRNFAKEKIEKKEKSMDIDNIKTDISSLKILLKYANKNENGNK
ncbi:MAG: hypothetical protein ACYCSQ_00085 [bacterium]